MLGMSALVDYFQVGLMAAADADENVGLVMFAEVSTETALSSLNRFHVLDPPIALRWGMLPTLPDYSSMTIPICKLRLNKS
jgi:hypothetical protein